MQLTSLGEIRSPLRNRSAVLTILISTALIISMVVTAPSAESAVTPGATTTGVPAGTPLKKHMGDLVIRKAGAVIDGYDIYGNVTVEAPNVTISRTRIRGTAAKVHRDLLRAVGSAAKGLLVVDSTIKPDTPTVYHRIGIRLSGSYQNVLRTEVSGTVDGIRINGNRIRVDDSWLHDFRHYAVDPEHSDGSHDDAIQVQGGTDIRIVGNSISGATNAAVMVSQGLAPISVLRIHGNYLDGGACTVNIAKKGYGYMTGLKANYNTFGRSLKYARCPMKFEPSHSDMSAVGNVWADTRKYVPLP